MYHFSEAVLNRAGDILPGHYIKLVDDNDSVITLAADNSGTPISTVSGIANLAKVDDNGIADFYVASGVYKVKVYGPDAVTLKQTYAKRQMIDATGLTGLPSDFFVNAVPSAATVKTFALGKMLDNMRVGAAPVRTRLGRFADVYTDATGISAGVSTNYVRDVRKVVGPNRAFRATVAAEEPFDSIATWTTTGTVAVAASGNPDIYIGNVARMNTGSTPGNIATLRKYFGVIPASFGVSVQMGMNTLLNGPAENCEMQVQNANGHLLKMRVYDSTVQFFHDGAWSTAFTSGAWKAGIFTEWWVEATFNSGANYTVRLFAGTQELPGFTGNLPSGTGGENGYIGFILTSSTVANRIFDVADLQIGSSCLPQNMNLVSVAQDVVTEPTTVTLAMLVEDVSLQTVFNTDLKAFISKNGESGPWYQVTLTNFNEVGVGILTTNCPVYLLAGAVTLPAGGTHSVSYRITSANSHFFSIHGVAWRVDA